MNRQEIFNQAYLGLKSQGFQKSMNTGVDGIGISCAYRGENGLKCAVGHLLQDEEYDSLYEGTSVDGLCRGTFVNEEFSEELNNKRKAFINRINLSDDESADGDAAFLDFLQSAHDNSVDSVDMQERLWSFARRHKLTVPEE